MNKHFFLLLLGLTGLSAKAQSYGSYPIQGVPFSEVRLNDAFWAPRILQNQTTTIPIATDQCYSTGRVANFQKAAAILQGRNIGWFATEFPFDDTDIYKLLEGMAYSYTMNPTQELRDSMNSLIGIVAAAQEPDGYLFTARTAGQPGHLHGWLAAERWAKDPDLSHELYNAGHLFEAAAAHYTATGERSLFDVATRLADLLVEQFLKGGLAYEPGHQIVEMGLVKLYNITGREDYLRLAKYFLDIRGVGGPGSLRSQYCQSHMPPADQREAVGHAVRATYMYSGMADVAAIMGDRRYLTAIEAIWENVAQSKYYITGGIGARHNGEAFGDNYELPNLSAYNETCAAIAYVYWNWRMFLLSGDAKYYDVLERTLYNGVLAGISLSGDHFFYPNPLESRGNYSRSAWFGCACCPSNLCRFMASIPGYVYAHKGDSVYVNLFAQGQATIQLDGTRTLTLSQQTAYPWHGDVTLRVDEAPADGELTLLIRQPGWAVGRPVPSNLYHYIDEPSAEVKLLVNGQPADYTMRQGYMAVKRTWQQGDQVSLSLPMDVHRVVSDARVRDDAGLVALERGPIVYCLEWPDNENQVFSSIVDDDAEIDVVEDHTTFSQWNTDVMRLEIHGQNKVYAEDDRVTTQPRTFTAIPYYTWANRGEGNMAVWLPRSEAKATVSLDYVAHTDTLYLAVAQKPTTASYAQDYPSQRYPVDRWRLSQSLGVSYAELTSLFGNEITYGLIEPNGIVNGNSTAAAPGHWLAADGHAVAWVANPSSTTNQVDVPYIFSELQTNDYSLRIGQYPQLCHQGDSYHFRQAITRVPTTGAPRRVVLDVRLSITDPAGAFSAAVNYARAFLDDEAYADVTGSPRTALQNAVEAQPLGNATYTTATERVYSTLTTFIASKLDEQEAQMQARTLDAVDTGDGTSEKTHKGTYTSGSNTGTYGNETWRDTPAHGFVQYTLNNSQELTEGLYLYLRFTTNDAGRSAIVTIDGKQLCELYVPSDIKDKNNYGMYDVEYPIPSEMMVNEDGTPKTSITFRMTATGTASIPGIFFLRLLSASAQQPYRFVPADWKSGDVNRVTNDKFDCSDGKLIVAAGTGSFNVCLTLNTETTDYYVCGGRKYLVVKGEGISADKAASNLWWLNGINKASAITPTFSKVASDGETVVAWNLSTCDLNANCRGDFWNCSTGFTCMGLTSNTGTARISYIGFESDIDTFYNTVGIKTTEGKAMYRDGAQDIYDLSGRHVGRLTAGASKASAAKKGIYIIGGRKRVK